jgi:eukaryotic-like serine/threonine-protein kinase
MAQARYIEGQGRYALAEVVGRGGFATVWRARCLGGIRGPSEVAIKIIPVYSAAERSRALREGQIAEGLRHKNVVETLEVIPSDTEVYLVTEFVRGQPLDEAARSYDLPAIEDALAQILEALAYAHRQGIIHRDIKPQNALVDPRGTVKLTDFGVAYRAGDTRLTRIGYAVGTPGYMAPEILDGADPSSLTDIYAVGATARALLARQPYEPPPRLREFVDRATSPNPSHRPRSASEALKLLTGRQKTRLRKKKSFGQELEHSGTIPGRLRDHGLRLANGAVAAWLGYLLCGQTLGLDGAQSAGIAAGLGVAGYLLPRLAALGVLVALGVALLRGGVGLATTVLSVGTLWVVAGGLLDGGIGRLPLGPVLAIPLSAMTLGAGTPLFLGGLMRPLGAALTSALGAVVLVGYELTAGDGRLPLFGGVGFRDVPTDIGPVELYGQAGRILQMAPEIGLLPIMWAVIAGVISLAEWAGRPFVGLGTAVIGGAVGYAAVISEDAQSLSTAMTSLGLAAILYAVLRYLGWRARG